MAISPSDIRGYFVQTIEAFAGVVQKRLLRTLDGIEHEADRVSREKWEEFGRYCGPDGDPALTAEMAVDAGISYFDLYSGLRHGLTNWCCAALYHLYEQQMLMFHRQQLLHPSEQNDRRLLNMKELKKRLLSSDIAIEEFPHWSTLEELRHLANAVKHGSGTSANRLAVARPDLFTHPCLRGERIDPPMPNRLVFLPLTGEGLFALEKDFERYVIAVIETLNELADQLER